MIDACSALREMDDWCRANGATWQLASYGSSYSATVIYDDGRKRVERNGRTLEETIDRVLDRIRG